MPETLTFDMYGTLVDPLGVQRTLEGRVADPEAVARRWRETQLRYAALLTAMEHYHDFGWVTERALEHALATSGEAVDPAERRELVAAYDELEAFPDTRPGLERLREAGHFLAVFSNGTRAMIERVVSGAGIADCFDDLISVDEVGTFKPSPRVYRHAAARAGREVGRHLAGVGQPLRRGRRCHGGHAHGLGGPRRGGLRSARAGAGHRGGGAGRLGRRARIGLEAKPAVGRTLVISDLHLGGRLDRDVLRRPEALDALLEALDGVERLVLLGDVVELLERRPRDALAEAAAGAAPPGRGPRPRAGGDHRARATTTPS